MPTKSSPILVPFNFDLVFDLLYKEVYSPRPTVVGVLTILARAGCLTEAGTALLKNISSDDELYDDCEVADAY